MFLKRSGDNMKIRTAVPVVALWLVAVAVCFGSDAQMGTWKLNEAKSKFTPGAAKNHTVIYEAAGDKVKITVDGKDNQMNAVHNEWTGNFDGKDYAVAGDTTSDTRSYKKIDDHTLVFTNKKDGKVILTGRVVVSADAKTRTVTTSETDDKGGKVTSTAVYRRAQ
jgi:hypothetical protein